MKTILNICFSIPVIIFCLMGIICIWTDDWVRFNTCLLMLLFILVIGILLYHK